MTIIPPGTLARWQGCIMEGDAVEWDELASDLLKSATFERDANVRDDILTLSMVACCLADDADQAVAFSLTPVEMRYGAVA
ncbi:MAG: hypothetical protein IE917_10750 [Betaproteobacteria bacterium]|nr:hypothetical protein [Betaproteobacteria bacterium]